MTMILIVTTKLTDEPEFEARDEYEICNFRWISNSGWFASSSSVTFGTIEGEVKPIDLCHTVDASGIHKIVLTEFRTRAEWDKALRYGR